MTGFQKDVIKLIKSGISFKKCQIDENIDFDALISCAFKNQIPVIIYYGLLNSNISKEKNELSSLKKRCYIEVFESNTQFYEIQEISAAFKQAGIDYQPLKGSLMKKFYPQPEMRSMGDIDILIKTSQYDKITEIMKNRGYIFKSETDHELIWQKEKNIFVELHKRLIPSYNPDMYMYYGEGWKIFDENSPKAKFKDENHYIYNFTHLAKHYRDSGIGIKHIVDMYVYLKAKPDMDFGYIYTELQILGLKKFYDNVMRTIEVWFEDGEPDEITEFLTEKIFHGGDLKTSVLSQGYKKTKSEKLRISPVILRIIATIFPSLNTMKSQYFILRRYSILLPVMWIYRWFEALFKNRTSFKRAVKRIKFSTRKNIEEYKYELNNVGLEYNGLNIDFPYEYCALLNLMSSSIFNTGEVMPNEADMKKVYEESIYQSVPVIAFDGMIKSGLPESIISIYKESAQNYLVKNIQIYNAHSGVHSLFEENGIPYCILKGTASAHYYPDPKLRSMGDIDFYVKPEYSEDAKRILLENGFKERKGDNEHHICFIKDRVSYEMHFSFPGVPIGELKDTVESYLSDTIETSRTVKDKYATFNMPDDFHHGLILLLHTSQHIHSEGIGLRHLYDWAVFVNRFTNEEFESIFKTKLERIGLLKFAQILAGVAVCYMGLMYKEWMGDIDSRLSEKLIMDVFKGGNFGKKNNERSQESFVISYYGKNSAEESVLKQLFISANNLSYNKFPVIKKFKLLLPIGWIYYFFRHLFKAVSGKRKWILSNKIVASAKERKEIYSAFDLFKMEK